MAGAKACAAHTFNKHHAVERALSIVTQYDKCVVVGIVARQGAYHAHDIAAPLVRVHKGKLQPGVDTLGSRLHLQQDQHKVAGMCDVRQSDASNHPGADTLGCRLHLQQTQHVIALACVETARCVEPAERSHSSCWILAW